MSQTSEAASPRAFSFFGLAMTKMSVMSSIGIERVRDDSDHLIET
jgi:hypothetical protein